MILSSEELRTRMRVSVFLSGRRPFIQAVRTEQQHLETSKSLSFKEMKRMS